MDSEWFVDNNENNLSEAQPSSGLYIKWTAEYKSACDELYKTLIRKTNRQKNLPNGHKI